MKRFDGWERIGVLITLAFLLGMAWSYMGDPGYYNRNPEDVLVGFWGIATYWGAHFSIKWVAQGFKGKNQTNIK